MNWYKRYPTAAFDGMRCLTLEEIGAYNIIIDLLYERDGNVPDDDRIISGWLRCAVQRWRRIKGRLMSLGKLTSENGFLTNSRASKELDHLRTSCEALRKLSRRGGQVSAEKRKEINETIQPTLQPLKTKNQTESLIREESKIVDIRPTADSRLPAGEFDWESSDGTIFVSSDQINRWSQMFPGVNVRAQLRGARREYLAGPMQTEVFCRRFEKGLRTKAEKKRIKEQQSIEHKTVARDMLDDEYELRQRALAVRKRHLGE